MKPFFLLLIVFGLAVGVTFLTGEPDYLLSGKIALGVMLLFTSIGHFKFTQGMVMMMPDFIPFRKPLVYITGFIEIIAAIAIFIETLHELAGWLLIVFFVVLLPANINAAMKHIDYEKATYDGKGLGYLSFRVPFQILLIVWTYFFVIRG